MLLTWLWVLVGAVGWVFAILVLREVLADQRAAETRQITTMQRLFLHESIRMTWYRVACLACLTLAGVPALIPLQTRPSWTRLLIIGLLILGEVLLTVDTALRLRAKRRMLGQLRRDHDRKAT
jgi:drug/metabolite transporter (DMT)-like permease